MTRPSVLLVSFCSMAGCYNHLAHRRVTEDYVSNLLAGGVEIHQVGTLLSQVGSLHAHYVGAYEAAIVFAEEKFADSVRLTHRKGLTISTEEALTLLHADTLGFALLLSKTYHAAFRHSEHCRGNQIEADTIFLTGDGIERAETLI